MNKIVGIIKSSEKIHGQRGELLKWFVGGALKKIVGQRGYSNQNSFSEEQ